MFSPALRHRQKKLAAKAVESGSSGDVAPDRQHSGAEATEYELLLAALGEDMARLRDIQSTEAKIAAKRDMIARYQPHVNATLEAATETGKAVQDELLATIMLWHIDIGATVTALDIAEHVLRFGLRMPERFQRTPACVVAEEIATAALAAIGQDQDYDLQTLLRTAQLTEPFDMPDVARAKLHKAIGLQLIREADAEADKGETAVAGAQRHARTQALESLRRALALAPKIGVKKEIERLVSWMNKNPPSAQEGEVTDEEE